MAQIESALRLDTLSCEKELEPQPSPDTEEPVGVSSLSMIVEEAQNIWKELDSIKIPEIKLTHTVEARTVKKSRVRSREVSENKKKSKSRSRLNLDLQSVSTKEVPSQK